MGNGTFVVPLLYHSGYWFANLSIGESATKYELMIDSAFSSVILYPGKYEPGPSATNLNKSVTIPWDRNQVEDDGTKTDGKDVEATGFTIDVYTDEVDFFSITRKNITLGAPTKAMHNHIGDGILGLYYTTPDPADNGTGSFMDVLCKNKLITNCRFGIAVPLDDYEGTLTLGGIETNITGTEIGPFFKTEYHGREHDGPLGTRWIRDAGGYSGRIYHWDIRHPWVDVDFLFQQAGFQSYTHNGTLIGYFPCDELPMLPTIGFTMYPDVFSEKYHHPTKTFNINPLALISGSVGNNCTLAIKGHNYDDEDGNWVLGLPFFRGRYIDVNFDSNDDSRGGTIGIADLIESP